MEAAPRFDHTWQEVYDALKSGTEVVVQSALENNGSKFVGRFPALQAQALRGIAETSPWRYTVLVGVDMGTFGGSESTSFTTFEAENADDYPKAIIS